MRVVLVPGWNEHADKMRTYVDGRNGRDGLAAYGLDCSIFTPHPDDALREQVDALAAFIDALAVREPDVFPIATIGYSAGGLVVRGLLRAYPEHRHRIRATIQVAAPNAGLHTRIAAYTLRVAHMPTHVLTDLDVGARFMQWLNGPDPDGKHRLVPEGHRFLHVVGRMPRYDLRSDGVVREASASYEGRVPVHPVEGDEANHLNLGAVYNPIATFVRRFAHDDLMWPRVVERCARFLRDEIA